MQISAEPYGSEVAQRLVDDLAVDIETRYAGDEDDSAEDHEYASQVTAADFAEPSGAFLVARLDETPAGCGGVRRYIEGVAELKRMYVAPEARRRGVARALLRALEDAARRLGYERLRLETGLRQPEAMALYEAAGYEVIDSYGYYKDSPLSVCYEKPLT